MPSRSAKPGGLSTDQVAKRYCALVQTLWLRSPSQALLQAVVLVPRVLSKSVGGVFVVVGSTWWWGMMARQLDWAWAMKTPLAKARDVRSVGHPHMFEKSVHESPRCRFAVPQA